MLVPNAAAQRPRAPRPGTNASNVLNLLPASDAVVSVDVRRLLNEAVPSVFAADPAKLAQVNAQIDKFKSQTGIDPRSCERLAVGLRYTYPSPGIIKGESVAIMRGTFNPAAIAGAGRIAASGKFDEQKYKGATICVFSLNEQIKLLGVYNLRVNNLAVSVLNANTLVVGSLSTVRAAIDAGKFGRRASSELVALAMRDPNALIAFAGNVTPALQRNLRLGNDETAKDVASIRQVYGSVGIKGAKFYVSLAARTFNPAQAKRLSDTITGLEQLAPLVVDRLPEARKKLARSALESLKITSQGNELRISTEVLQVDVASVIR